MEKCILVLVLCVVAQEHLAAQLNSEEALVLQLHRLLQEQVEAATKTTLSLVFVVVNVVETATKTTLFVCDVYVYVYVAYGDDDAHV